MKNIQKHYIKIAISCIFYTVQLVMSIANFIEKGAALSDCACKLLFANYSFISSFTLVARPAREAMSDGIMILVA